MRRSVQPCETLLHRSAAVDSYIHSRKSPHFLFLKAKCDVAFRIGPMNRSKFKRHCLCFFSLFLYGEYNGMQFIGIDAQIIRHIDITFISDWLFKQLNLTLVYVFIYWKTGHYLKKPRPENIRKKVNLVLNILCKAIRLFKHGNQFSKPDVFLSLSSCSERCLELLVAMATFTLTIPYCSGFQSGPAWGPTALHISYVFLI